jgi:hypothetical protein
MSKKQTPNGYKFLRELCSFKADFNAFKPSANPETNRVNYITYQLAALNIPFTIDKFIPTKGTPDAKDGDICYVNVVVEIKGKNTKETTVFLAHHDVNNKDSENCQDNTASVANLLDMCVRFKSKWLFGLFGKKPKNNITIVFTDAEEIVNPNISGAARLANNILAGKYGMVKYCINLELTANGRNYWVASPYENSNKLSTQIKHILPSIHEVQCPFNDSVALELAGLSSVCVGSLDDESINSKFKTWGLCHSKNDTFDKAVESDMSAFVDFLITLV